MRISARRFPTSTCPLCRAEVARRLGVECATCGAVAHRECIQELGGCHGTRVEEPPAQESPGDRRRAAVRGRPPSARRAPVSLEREGPSPALLVFGGVAAVAVLVTAICGGLRSGPQGFLITGAMGSLSLFQAWSGLRTGVVDTTAKNSSEVYSWDREPFSFVFHVTVWAIFGLFLTFLALAPLFAD